MSKRYYVLNPTNKNFPEEVTKEQWYKLIGRREVSGYANQVYQEIITIDEVPVEYQEEVETIVSNKIAKWGEYVNQAIFSLI